MHFWHPHTHEGYSAHLWSLQMQRALKGKLKHAWCKFLFKTSVLTSTKSVCSFRWPTNISNYKLEDTLSLILAHVLLLLFWHSCPFVDTQSFDLNLFQHLYLHLSICSIPQQCRLCLLHRDSFPLPLPTIPWHPSLHHPLRFKFFRALKVVVIIYDALNIRVVRLICARTCACVCGVSHWFTITSTAQDNITKTNLNSLTDKDAGQTRWNALLHKHL